MCLAIYVKLEVIKYSQFDLIFLKTNIEINFHYFSLKIIKEIIPVQIKLLKNETLS